MTAPDRIFLGHTTNIVQTSITRPNNTTQYAIGDVVATAAGDPVIVFDAVARSAGGAGMIMTAKMVDSANQATPPILALWLFKARPLSVNTPADNAAFNPSDADMLNLVGVIDLVTPKIGDATVGAGGNLVIQSDVIALPFKCAGGDDALYGVYVMANTYTPLANEVFTPDVTVLQDY